MAKRLRDRGGWMGWPDRWRALREALLLPKVPDGALAEALGQARAQHPLPLVWLIGRTQSGKTSIVRALTGSPAAEVGSGFRPCTAASRVYDFPADAPLVRFLDTRGLGEVAYDPTPDIAYAESSAHLLLAVMKVADTHQDEVLDLVRSLRRRHPEWPLVIAQTALHEAYAPGQDHPLPYPFDRSGWAAAVPPDLARLLLAQRQQARDLPGTASIHWVPIDLTLGEDGFEPPDYGLDALWAVIEASSTLHLEALLRADGEIRDLYARAAHPHIVGYALAAAGLGALPLVDLAAVPAVQAKMLQSLATVYGQPWDRRAILEFLGLLGTGIGLAYAARSAGRGLLKLTPFWGQTAGALWGASAGGVTTFALGKAAGVYFDRRRQGLPADAEALRRAYREGIERGAELIEDLLRRDSP